MWMSGSPELTQKMLRRKFYAVISKPSPTPEKLKALLPGSIWNT